MLPLAAFWGHSLSQGPSFFTMSTLVLSQLGPFFVTLWFFVLLSSLQVWQLPPTHLQFCGSGQQH